MNIHFKKMLVLVLAATLTLSGCASVQSRSTSTPGKSEAEYKKEEVAGSKDFLSLLGLGLMMGIIFAVAPKEAYR
jgi:uncharacterized protein YceK